MDALILSMGTGGGHNAAASAVKEELERRGHSAELINPYKLKSEALAKRVDSIYINAATSAPHLFGLIYKIGAAVSKLPCRSPIYFANKRSAEHLRDLILVGNYDVIITTHLFAGEMLTVLKNSGIELPKTVFIATDYTCSPFEGEVKADAFVVPSKDLIPEFMNCGISLKSCYSLGIPTSLAFSEKASKEDMKKALGLDPAEKYILVCGGSMGAGNLERIIKRLMQWCHENDHTRVIAVCGSNTKLFEKLFTVYGNDIVLYRFTDKMPELLKASDVCFTKPGGLSSTEAAAVGIPLVHITPIPGCETINMKYFSERGMSLKAKPTKKSVFKALEYLSDRQNRLEMVRRQREGLNISAASDICDLAEGLASEKQNKSVGNTLPS